MTESVPKLRRLRAQGYVLGAAGLHAPAHTFCIAIPGVVAVALDLAVSVAGCGGAEGEGEDVEDG